MPGGRGSAIPDIDGWSMGSMLVSLVVVVGVGTGQGGLDDVGIRRR